MDWEYQNNQGPLDISSPFAQVAQRPFAGSPFHAASPSRPPKASNPFAALGAANPNSNAASSSPLKPTSPSKQLFPRPSASSIFNAPATRQFPAASPFRNPAFTTPQKRADDVLSEYSASAAEESPAMASDMSELVVDSPERDRQGREVANMTITPASMTSRKLFAERKNSLSSRTPGRGEVPRGSLEAFFTGRSKVRKRRRQGADKDVGSVRTRFQPSAYSSEASGSDQEDDTDVSTDRTARERRGGSKRGKSGKKNSSSSGGGQAEAERGRGVLGNLFTVIHEHPNVPLILSWWVQLGINVFVVAVFMWFVWGGISMMRADIAHAADAARSRLLTEMNACAHEYTKNRCAPKTERLPALHVVCDEWEVCMNQDPSSVMKMQVSAKNVAEIINEFVGAMSIKAWGFIISAMLAMVLASNLGFSRFREAAFVSQPSGHVAPQQPYASQPAGAPLLPPSQDPNQAYIWAPIGQTPRHIRREFLPDTPTDTDVSPESSRAALMAPPETPPFRRSPSKKGERSHSPTKGGGGRYRSPSKGY